MNYLILLLVIVVCIICKLLIERKKEQENKKIESDAFIVENAIKIVSTIKNLEEEKFNLIFEKGSVYYETPNESKKYLVAHVCTLNDEENKNFAELIYNSLSKENGISVKIDGTKIAITK